MKNEIGGGNSEQELHKLITLRKLPRILLLLICHFTFEPIPIGVCTVPAGVFN